MADDETLDGPLPPWARWLVGVVGLGLTVAGVFSVFLENASVAGVPVLLVLGVALMYVAASGQRLLQVNKDGVVLGRAARLIISEVVADPDIPEPVKARLVETAEDSGLRITSSSARFLESVVRGRFAILGRSNGFEVRQGQPGSGADLVLVNVQGREIPVEVKSGPSASTLHRTIQALQRLPYSQRILVTDASVSARRIDDAKHHGVWILRSSPGADESWLAVLRSLEFLSSPPVD